MDKNETSTFAQRAAAAKSNETIERELRIARVVDAVLSKPYDGVNTRTTATFTAAGGRSFKTNQNKFERRKQSQRSKRKTLREEYKQIWK